MFLWKSCDDDNAGRWKLYIASSCSYCTLPFSRATMCTALGASCLPFGGTFSPLSFRITRGSHQKGCCHFGVDGQLGPAANVWCHCICVKVNNKVCAGRVSHAHILCLLNVLTCRLELGCMRQWNGNFCTKKFHHQALSKRSKMRHTSSPLWLLYIITCCQD